MNEKYLVKLWCGAGYMLSRFGVEASNNEEALDKTCVFLIKKGYTNLYHTLEKIELMMNEDGVDYLSDEAFDWENENGFLYRDATMEGAPYPIYLNSENLDIENVKEFPADEDIEVVTLE